MRHLVVVFAAVLIAACGQEQAAPPASAPAPVSDPSDWAASYLGGSFAEAFPNVDRHCMGSADATTVDATSTRIRGWAWDRAQTRAFDRLISVGADGVINGSGTTVRDRPDVVRAVGNIVTTPRVGFEVVTSAMSGTVRIYGLSSDASTACLVEAITF